MNGRARHSQSWKNLLITDNTDETAQQVAVRNAASVTPLVTFTLGQRGRSTMAPAGARTLARWRP